MDIRHLNLTNCNEAHGCVVAIDVIRAFTTAAFAFDAGAAEILSTDDTDAAFHLKEAHPGSIAMGEESDGADIGFFEMNNSPWRLREQDLHGKTIIHRTTSGTVGLVRPQHADKLLACSLVNAAATAKYIQDLQPAELCFVETGIRPGGRGDEDTACADYIESILTGKPVSERDTIERVLSSQEIKFFEQRNFESFPLQDLCLVTQMNCFNFAMSGSRISPHCVRLTAKKA